MTQGQASGENLTLAGGLGDLGQALEDHVQQRALGDRLGGGLDRQRLARKAQVLFHHRRR
jgi:hypothetical protein